LCYLGPKYPDLQGYYFRYTAKMTLMSRKKADFLPVYRPKGDKVNRDEEGEEEREAIERTERETARIIKVLEELQKAGREKTAPPKKTQTRRPKRRPGDLA
jgi:hypothetical protein